MTLGFDCPNCGDTTAFDDGTEVEDIRGRVYECDGCGANIKLTEVSA